MRLDKYLSEYFDVTRNQAVKLIESGNCTVNSVVNTSKKYIIETDDEVDLIIPEAEPCDILPEDIPLDVLYEDDSIIVVNKPRGMVVHPAPGLYSGTLVNALMYHCGDSLSGINGVIRPGIVHRIDKDTSGLLIVAKNDMAHVSLAEQLKNRDMLREYEAVVHGRVKSEQGETCDIDAPIGRSSADRKKMCVNAKNSRWALTFYSVIKHYEKFTHMCLELETGRTHQIRVHMQYIGHPVAGDSVYGNGKPTSLGGQCLHAKKLGFIHPKSGEYIEIDSELPEYFTEFLGQLKL